MNLNADILPELQRPETFFKLGWQLLYEEGRFADSEAAFKTALELAPENVEILLELAVASLLQGKADEGIAVLRQVIELSQDDDTLAEAHLRLGVAYDNLENKLMANIELDILRTLDPDRAEVLEKLMGWY